jgi:hypothetical protein
LVTLQRWHIWFSEPTRIHVVVRPKRGTPM